LLTFIRLLFITRSALIAENLFLRRQLALFQEPEIKPKPTTPAIRLVMVVLGRLFNWREALVIVKPETFIRWHRTMFRAFSRWKSRKRGRPALSRNIRELVREMARDNPSRGEEQIANELSLKQGIPGPPQAKVPNTAWERRLRDTGLNFIGRGGAIGTPDPLRPRRIPASLGSGLFS